MKPIIREIELRDVDALLDFCDKWIGENYFSKVELRTILLKSVKADLNSSFLALDEAGENILGVRLTLAPGEWHKLDSYKNAINPDLWTVPVESVAYFKSLFVDERYQRHGLGTELSRKSIKVLRHMGAKAVLCHSWLESPNNSSHKYLARLGFKSVAKHPDFWIENDYHCTRCAPNRCRCTGDEMIMYL